MVASQPQTKESGSYQLLDGRMAQTSKEVEEDLLEENETTMFSNGVDWIEGTLVLSF